MRLPGIVATAEGKVLDAGDMLIFAAGFSPVYGKQILYFRDPVFSKRAKIPAPETDRLHGVVDVIPVSFPHALPTAPSEEDIYDAALATPDATDDQP